MIKKSRGPRRLKYTLYKKFRNDIYGDFIVKGKSSSKAYWYLLKSFEFYLFKKIFPKFKNFNYAHTFNRINPKFKKKKKFSFKGTGLLTKNLNFKFERPYLKLNGILSFNKNYIRSIINQVYTAKSFYDVGKNKLKSQRDYNFIKKNSYWFRFKSIYNMGNNFNLEKKKPYWWHIKYEERRVSLFYGINNIKKFRLLMSIRNNSSKLNLMSSWIFETFLTMILYRLGFFDNIYAANKLIRRGFVCINSRVILNPYYKVKLNDTISINKRFMRIALILFYYKLKNMSFHFVIPHFMECDFHIMHFSIIKIPTKLDFINIGGPIYNISGQWFNYSNPMFNRFEKNF